MYETWCETCLREEQDKIDDEEDISDKEKEEEKGRIKINKYVGETAKSVYERGMEHQNGLEKMEEENHMMMKHIANYHQDKEIGEVKFGIRVLKFTQSGLERQILKSVKIQEEKKKRLIINSKAEYSRCTIQRLTTKMGDTEYDESKKKEKREE